MYTMFLLYIWLMKRYVLKYFVPMFMFNTGKCGEVLGTSEHH